VYGTRKEDETYGKFEVIAGIATGVLAITSSAIFFFLSQDSEILKGSLFYVGVALLIAGGSYLHVFRRSLLGLILLLVMSLVYGVFGAIVALIYFARGGWIGVPLVLPMVTAVVSVVAGLFNWERSHP